MKNNNRTRDRVLKFIEQYAKKYEALPTLDMVHQGMNHQKGNAIRQAYNMLYEDGVFRSILENAKNAKRREQYDKVVRITKDSSRSGVREMKKEEIELKSYPVGDMNFYSSGVTWEFLFTVDRSRGQGDFDKAQQPWTEGFSRYGESLVSGMFKNW